MLIPSSFSFPPFSFSLSLHRVELSIPFSCLESAEVGDLCCALYSEDQRWYTGRVMEILKGKKVQKLLVSLFVYSLLILVFR